MVLTGEQFRCATAFSNNCICSMPTDIVERSELQVLTEDYEELNACERESMVIARFCEFALMAHKKPGLKWSALVLPKSIRK